MTERFDILVVGARCAGASFAAFMARLGARVLIVDQARLPSDLVLSTHVIHSAGMQVLDALGVGESVRQVAPPMRSIHLNWYGAVLNLPLQTQAFEYCPRRLRLDSALQDAALNSGAEIRDQTRAVAIEQRGNRVSGVRLQNANGREYRVKADWIVGADGVRSRVAEWVNAPMYYDYEPPRAIYWSYWPAPAGWGQTEHQPGGMHIEREGTLVRLAFHTDDDQLLVGALPLRKDSAPFRADALSALQAALRSSSALARVVEAPPLEKLRGYLGQRYFFRRAVGPGWLLLGDAGLHKDFISGDGISEALLQAQRAARALSALGDVEKNLERWEAHRDWDAFPYFNHAQDLAAEGGQGVLEHVLFPEVQRDAEFLKRFRGVFERTHSPYETAHPLTVMRLCLGATLRGRRGVLRELWNRAQRTRWVQTEMNKLRRRLKSLGPTELEHAALPESSIARLDSRSIVT